MIRPLLFAVSAAATISTASAQVLTPRCELTNPNGGSGDHFGLYLDLSTTHIRASAQLANVVFDAKTCAPSIWGYWSASLYRDILLRRLDDDSPLEFLDGSSGWSLIETFDDDKPADDDVFRWGSGRQLDADTLVVVGSLLTGTNWYRLGVYHREAGGWSRKALIEEPAKTTTGSAYVLNGNWLAIASVREARVMLYRREGEEWVPHTLLEPLVPETGFGAAIALDRDTLVVGEPSGPVGEWEDRGAISIYRFDGAEWHLDARLVSSRGGPDWGESVALSDNLLVVGAGGHGQLDSNGRGFVEVFRRTPSNTWDPVGWWPTPSSDAVSDGTGSAVAVHRATVLAGAPYYYGNDYYTANGGRVFVFDIPPLDQDGDGFDETVDCADLDPHTYPGAPELPDGLDNNCDGRVDMPPSPDDTEEPEPDPPEEPDDPGDPEPPAAEADSSSCGCATSRSAPAGALGLLALAWIRRRR